MIRENTKLIAAFVVPVLIIAGVVGYQMYREEEIAIEVDEGFDDITIMVPYNQTLSVIEFPENESHRAMTTSYVNGDEGYLRLEAHPRVRGVGRDQYHVDIVLYLKGNFTSELNPAELIIEAQVVEAPGKESNHIDWLTSCWESDGLDLWAPRRQRLGSAGGVTIFLGSDIVESEFSTGIRLICSHSTEYSFFEEPLTIEFRAIVRGLSEDVVATARISFYHEVVL